MTIEHTIIPVLNETPSKYADRLAIYYSSMIDDIHKKNLGQFFTPLKVSEFMASFEKSDKEKIKILDPGCGIGILSTTLAEAIISNNKKIKEIELVAFETDVAILTYSEDCFSYLGKWLKRQGVEFTYFLCKNDFILHNSHLLNKQPLPNESYDIIISNPPYFKLPKGDQRAMASKSVTYGQTNIYSIFLIIAAKLLNNTGQLIFISPRSFCSGSYFRLFREVFFGLVDIEVIHLFNSRKNTFKRDKVLQENIIVTARKKLEEEHQQMQLPFTKAADKQLTISSSIGIQDVKERTKKNYNFKDLININSYQKILFLPITDIDEQIISVFKKWSGSLSQYDLDISTGPVVDFRSLPFISFGESANTVPLLWLHNVSQMKIDWPKDQGYKGKQKGQYIFDNELSRSRLVPNRNYVLLRRFSTKDDNRRLIAAPYIRKENSSAVVLGIENHLNYIYHKNRELSKIETIGLSVILNSQLFDLYFRTFNGNINVSATELRDFPLPAFELIKKIGQKTMICIKKGKNLDIDFLIKQVFNLKIDLSAANG